MNLSLVPSALPQESQYVVFAKVVSFSNKVFLKIKSLKKKVPQKKSICQHIQKVLAGDTLPAVPTPHCSCTLRLHYFSDADYGSQSAADGSLWSLCRNIEPSPYGGYCPLPLWCTGYHYPVMSGTKGAPVHSLSNKCLAVFNSFLHGKDGGCESRGRERTAREKDQKLRQ